MFDGSELGRAIAAHPDDLEAALQQAEEAMFTRSSAEAADSAELHETMFGERAPQSMVDFFARAGQPG